MHMYTRKSRPKNNEISLDSKDELKFYEKGLYHGVKKINTRYKQHHLLINTAVTLINF